MWKSEKTAAEIERLLSRYRPAEPRRELWDHISTFPHSQISKSPRTWPWAIAAAAFLTVPLGLHGAVVPAPDATPAVDTQRVNAIEEELGRAPGSEFLAEWIARAERGAGQGGGGGRAGVAGG